MPRLQLQLFVETALALCSAGALALTLAWPQWIEDIVGLDPDGGDGSSEWGWTLALLVATALASAAAWRGWRHLRHLRRLRRLRHSRAAGPA